MISRYISSDKFRCGSNICNACTSYFSINCDNCLDGLFSLWFVLVWKRDYIDTSKIYALLSHRSNFKIIMHACTVSVNRERIWKNRSVWNIWKKIKEKKIYADIAYCQTIKLKEGKLHTFKQGPGAHSTYGIRMQIRMQKWNI